VPDQNLTGNVYQTSEGTIANPKMLGGGNYYPAAGAAPEKKKSNIVDKRGDMLVS